MLTRCLCICHSALGAPARSDGMDVTDPIEATVACRHCQPVHAPAFSGTPDELTRPAYPKKPATEWRDANGANGEDGG